MEIFEELALLVQSVRLTKWMFPKIGVPWKNFIKMDDLGVPLFLETPKFSSRDVDVWFLSGDS